MFMQLLPAHVDVCNGSDEQAEQGVRDADQGWGQLLVRAGAYPMPPSHFIRMWLLEHNCANREEIYFPL